jgi:acyl carrier protein
MSSHRTPASVAESLESFVRDRFQVRPDDAYFTRTADLWEEGYVDSTGVVEVIAFLEETYAIALPEAVLFSPDFRFIDGIARLVAAL